MVCGRGLRQLLAVHSQGPHYNLKSNVVTTVHVIVLLSSRLIPFGKMQRHLFLNFCFAIPHLCSSRRSIVFWVKLVGKQRQLIFCRCLAFGEREKGVQFMFAPIFRPTFLRLSGLLCRHVWRCGRPIRHDHLVF